MKIVELHKTNQALASSAITLSRMTMAGTRLTSAEIQASWRPPVAHVTALRVSHTDSVIRAGIR